MRTLATLLSAAFTLFAVGAATAGTLDQVKARGELICGANPGLAGFGLPDDQGVYKGLDVDECRAIAAAIFNDPNKVKYLPINAKDRPTILASGQIDVLIRNTTWTLSRETGGMFFTGVNYYDGQGFMVRKKLGVDSALKLDGASVCVQQGTTTELNLADYLPRPQHEIRAGGLRHRRRGDQGLRLRAAATPTRPTPPASTPSASSCRRPTTISCCPRSSPRSRSARRCARTTCNGSRSCNGPITRWSNAEELGVTQANVDQMLKSDNPAIRRLLGVEGDFGKGSA